MLVYWVIFLWLLLFATVLQRQMSKEILTPSGAMEYQTDRRYMWLILLVPIFFAALRTECVDTGSYIRDFAVNTPTDWTLFDVFVDGKKDSQLFYGLQMFFKNFIWNNASVWIALIAILQLGLVGKTVARYSVNPGMSIYYFYASCLMINWVFNGMRQFIVVSILFACTHWILENKMGRYFIVLLLLMGLDPIGSWLGFTPVWFLRGIHQSALIMIPIVLCIKGKAFNKRLFLLMAFLFIVIITGNIDNLLGSATSGTTYADDLIYAKANTVGGSIIRFFVSFVPVGLVLYRYPQIVYDEETPPVIHLAINASVVSSFLYFISTMTSGMFVGRLPIYCEIYNLILIPWLLHHPYKENRKVFSYAVYALYFLYFIFQMQITWGGLTYVSKPLGIYLRGAS